MSAASSTLLVVPNSLPSSYPYAFTDTDSAESHTDSAEKHAYSAATHPHTAQSDAYSMANASAQRDTHALEDASADSASTETYADTIE